jgi:hypothetical protein
MTTDKSDPIKAEAARYKAATTAAAKSRAALTELVVAALREPGAKPADIANRADWTSAYVRKLAREHGIEADPAYKARTEKARARMLAEAVAAQTSQPAPEPNERPSPKPTPLADHRANVIAALTDQQAANLAVAAFPKADRDQYRALEAASAGGDRAVVAAALDLGVLTETELLIA